MEVGDARWSAHCAMCEAFPLHNIGRLPVTWQMRPLLSRSSQAGVLADPNLDPAHLVMLVKVRSALTRSRTHPPRSTAVQIAAIRKASEAHLKGFLAEHVGVQEETPRPIVYGDDYSHMGSPAIYRAMCIEGHTDHKDENLTSDPSQPSHTHAPKHVQMRKDFKCG